VIHDFDGLWTGNSISGDNRVSITGASCGGVDPRRLREPGFSRQRAHALIGIAKQFIADGAHLEN
jgi:hypothetical protein